MNRVVIGGEQLTPLGGETAYKYLGLCIKGDGTTQGEKRHILNLVGDRTRQLRHHPYSVEQALDVVRTVVHPAITYSSAVTSWTQREVVALQAKMSGLYKAVWRLLPCHNTAPFLLPPGLGGVLEHQMVVLMGRAIVGMMGNMQREGMDSV